MFQTLLRLILDRLRSFEATKDLRASLEDTWRNSTRLKLRREEEEQSFRRWVEEPITSAPSRFAQK